MFIGEWPRDQYPEKGGEESGIGQWGKSCKMLYYKKHTITVVNLGNKEKQKEATPSPVLTLLIF